MRFRRKKDEEDAGTGAAGADEETAEREAVAGQTPDDATWALPADAAVASGGDVATPSSEPSGWQNADDLETSPAASQMAADPDPQPEPISGGAIASPGAGIEDGPRAAAAAAAESYTARPEPSRAAPSAGAASAPAATDDRPELLVAGAFVGAFLFAKIVKRIGD